MTDKQTLLIYRLNQAKETLSDAQKMLKSGVGPRSVVNRAYYAMFYAVLALFIHHNIAIKTSKHSGIISIFDREFILTGIIEKEYSKTLHRIFDARQEFDYREMIDVSDAEAALHVKSAEAFLHKIELLTERA